MKRVLTFLMLVLPVWAFCQINVGFGTMQYQDGSVDEVRNEIKTRTAYVELSKSVNLSPYRGDGHELVIYAQLHGQVNDGVSYYSVRPGFTFLLNALPIINKDNIKAGFKTGLGFGYDHYIGIADFQGVLKAYVNVNRLTIQTGVQTYVLDCHFWGMTREYFLGVNYRIGK